MAYDIALTRDLTTCLELRKRVFIDEQGVSLADEIDGKDEEALHLLATRQGEPVGTARILLGKDTGKIGRVCVLKHARGLGLGAALIRKAVQICADRAGVSRAVLGAQVYAIPFYERLGFVAFGPVYDDAGIDHRDMECPL